MYYCYRYTWTKVSENAVCVGFTFLTITYFVFFYHLSNIHYTAKYLLEWKLKARLPFPAYFTTTVQMVYNLLYYQVVAQVSCGLTGAERARAASGAVQGQIANLCDSLNLINECLGQTDLYMEDDSASCSGKTQVNILALEQQVS